MENSNFIQANAKSNYPFEHGDDYYIVENGKVIWSCWDDVSEELYTLDTQYFATEKEAKKYMKTQKKYS